MNSLDFRIMESGAMMFFVSIFFLPNSEYLPNVMELTEGNTAADLLSALKGFMEDVYVLKSLFLNVLISKFILTGTQ